MSWAQRLKRAFNIDISGCVQCGGIWWIRNEEPNPPYNFS